MTNVRDLLYGGCALLVVATGVACVAANAADMPVYKCKQANGAVAYQDYPCKGGVVVDIKPETPDPAAIARFERAQSEFNRNTAARAELALRQEELALRRREIEASRAPYDTGAPAPSSGYYSGYTGYYPGTPATTRDTSTTMPFRTSPSRHASRITRRGTGTTRKDACPLSSACRSAADALSCAA